MSAMDIPQAFVNGYYSLTAGRTYDRLMSRSAGSRKEFWENVPLAPAQTRVRSPSRTARSTKGS